ncbi:MAG: riboflavin synthase [Gammaproteobacteria bacterium]|nr:riboflavin synthase [Gammaproteobacteria bacterium]MBT8149775.1 riboflavin synthase [Gammaproteobacteria bacterium]NND39686.1 riboflavin synthase [Pseudomonadales bacterium]NNL11159.1 riboflavin synthase [Pseudomonadales bacterium]NNM10809.1 riboflavin synthase [Pseudomonadales bacterium]
MFTGIVLALGEVETVETIAGDKRFIFSAPGMDFADLKIGDSIAVNGVCLTATELDAPRFAADVSRETLDCTTLGALAKGSAINLEKSLTPSTALGGHLVSGHVDGVAKVVAIEQDARSVRVDIQVPGELGRYIAAKGSVCIDGTSLTVNTVDGDIFGINIIPHTFENTLFNSYSVGSAVNIEVDIIARYVERISTYTAPR